MEEGADGHEKQIATGIENIQHEENHHADIHDDKQDNYNKEDEIS